MDCLGPSGAGPLHRTPSDLGDQNSPYLDQAVPLRVKELEDLLEVLDLVLGEPLGLLGHGGGVGGGGGGAVGTCLGTRALELTGAGQTHRPTRRPTATATAFLCAPALCSQEERLGALGAQLMLGSGLGDAAAGLRRDKPSSLRLLLLLVHHAARLRSN